MYVSVGQRRVFYLPMPTYLLARVCIHREYMHGTARDAGMYNI